MFGREETASPRRMGAALTYARRYALFALVGIAGEDDLDAPDVPSSTPQINHAPIKPCAARQNGGQRATQLAVAPRRDNRPRPPTANPVLELHASAKLRERLIAEICAIGSARQCRRLGTSKPHR